MKTKYLSLLLALLTCSVVFGQNNNAWQQQQQQQRMLEQQRMQQEQQRMQQEQQRRMQEQQRMEQQRRMEEMQRQRAQQMEAQRRQQQEAMRQQQEAARRQQQIQQQQVRDRQVADQRQRQTAQVQQRMQTARTNTVNQQRRNIAASIVKQKQPLIAPRQTATAPAAQGKSAPQTKSAALKATVKASVDKAKIALTQKKTAEVKQETGRMRAEIKRLQGKTQMLRAKLQTLIKTQQAQAKAAAKAAIAKMKGLSALRAKAKDVPPAQAKPKPKGEICFVAGTLVKTIKGLVPIEDIRVGDLVWSRDDQTGDEGWKPVVHLFTTHPTELVHLSYTIEGSPDERTLTGTAIHPFWSEDRQQWMDMGDLDINETLSLDDADRNATVSRIEREIAPTGQAFTTFNFEVAGWHTYFVAPKNSPPADAGIWVHNQSKDICQKGLARLENITAKRGPALAKKILSTKGLSNSSSKKIQELIQATKTPEDNLKLTQLRLQRLGYNEESQSKILLAIKNGEPVVIVGENMRRVAATARMIDKAGGKSVTYSPRNFTGVNTNTLEANRSWLRYWVKEKGAQVIDIGRQKTIRRDGPSPFYGIEKQSLRAWNVYSPHQDQP